MTAIVAVNRGPSIDILADAAIYKPSGTVVAFASKVLPVGRMLIVASGSVHTWPAIERALSSPGVDTIDRLLARQDRVFAAFDHYLTSKGVADVPCDVLVGGWSNAAKRMMLTLRVNHARHGVPAGTFMALDQFNTGPAPIGAADFSVEAAVASIEAQRRTPARIQGMNDDVGEPVCNVGGWIDHARLTAGGKASVTRVRTWAEDRIGQPMRLELDAATG